MSIPSFEPDWAPLEKVQGHLHGEVGRFMFMHSGEGLYYYKHKDTRSYLVLDAAGHAYGERDASGLAEPVGIEYAVRLALGGFHPDVQLDDLDGYEPWWPGFDAAREAL